MQIVVKNFKTVSFLQVMAQKINESNQNIGRRAVFRGRGINLLSELHPESLSGCWNHYNEKENPKKSSLYERNIAESSFLELALNQNLLCG